MGIKAPRLKKKQSKRWAKHDSIDNPCKKCPKLVGGFNPLEKYESKWESSPNSK